MLFLVCSYHAYVNAFQSKSTLCSCLNVRELLVWSRREIWSLNDSNWIRTYSHLIHKRMFLYEVSEYGFESSCCHFAFPVCKLTLQKYGGREGSSFLKKSFTKIKVWKSKIKFTNRSSYKSWFQIWSKLKFKTQNQTFRIKIKIKSFKLKICETEKNNGI